MTPAWRRILIVGGFVLGVGIVGLLAFNTYAILTEEDGKTEPQLAEATETATPTPVVDVELSRECLGR